MDLSVITVTYQSKNYIDGCILSVVTSTFCPYEHIVVDNGSTDGTVELIEEGYASYVALIKNEKNLGFAAANNQAVNIAKGRYVLFLNPDMQIKSGTLDSLIQWMDAHPEAGLAGCKLVTENNECLPPMRFAHPSVFLPFFLCLKGLQEIYEKHILYPRFDEHKEQEIEHPRGSFLLVRKKIIDKLGFGFDPRYFIYFEDADLCREILKLNYKIYYLPHLTCTDFRGRSAAVQSLSWRYFRWSRSLKKYAQKWHSPLHLLWLNPAIFLGILMKSLKTMIRKGGAFCTRLRELGRFQKNS